MPTDGLISVDELREQFAIDPEIHDARFTRALAAAGRQMRGWVGDEAYDDALSATPDDATRKADLQLAEAYLVMGLSVLGINTALRPTGIVKTERVEGQVVITYHSPAEVEKLQALYLQTAEDIARAYLVVEESTEPFGAVVGGSDSSCEGVTRRCG
jgi:hypothetical protein